MWGEHPWNLGVGRFNHPWKWYFGLVIGCVGCGEGKGSGRGDDGGRSGCWLLQSVRRSFAKVDIALKVSSPNLVGGKILGFLIGVEGW